MTVNSAILASSFNWILFSLICFCWICCVTTKNKTKSIPSLSPSPSPPPPPPLSTAQVKCGDTQKLVDECFKDLPPHLMEFLQTTKIVANEDEIASKCIVFKRGMTCFDNYTTRCLTNEKFMVFRNNVAGARRFLSKFCDDRKFQEDYLKHKDCFAYIQDDWKKCTKDFQHILSEELHSGGSLAGDDKNANSENITRKFMQFCCTRHAYENCIYNSARYKCYPHSAQFARDTAKLLSEEKHFSNCRQYEHVLCAASSSRLRDQQPPAALLLPLLLLLPPLLMNRFNARSIRYAIDIQ